MKKSIQAPASVQTDNNLISIATATERYTIHKNTLLNWIRLGLLQITKGKHNKYYFSESDLVQIMAKRGYFVQGA